MLEGARQRDVHDWEVAAWIVANLMNVSGKTLKKKMTPSKLLGRTDAKLRTQQDKVLDFEEIIRRRDAS